MLHVSGGPIIGLLAYEVMPKRAPTGRNQETTAVVGPLPTGGQPVTLEGLEL